MNDLNHDDERDAGVLPIVEQHYCSSKKNLS
jgi:hypothetical protein